jgi:hypothetical protein
MHLAKKIAPIAMAIAPATPTEIPAICAGARTLVEDGPEVGVEIGSELITMVVAVEEELGAVAIDDVLVLVLDVVHVEPVVDGDDAVDNAVDREVVGGNKLGAPDGGTTKVAVSVG